MMNKTKLNNEDEIQVFKTGKKRTNKKTSWPIYINPLDGKFYIVLDDKISYEILSDDQGIEYIELVYTNDRIFAYNELNE